MDTGPQPVGPEQVFRARESWRAVGGALVAVVVVTAASVAWAMTRPSSEDVDAKIKAVIGDHAKADAHPNARDRLNEHETQIRLLEANIQAIKDSATKTQRAVQDLSMDIAVIPEVKRARARRRR